MARYLQVITVPWNGVDRTRVWTSGLFEYIAISLFLPPTHIHPYTGCLCVLYHTHSNQIYTRRSHDQERKGHIPG